MAFSLPAAYQKSHKSVMAEGHTSHHLTGRDAILHMRLKCLDRWRALPLRIAAWAQNACGVGTMLVLLISGLAHVARAETFLNEATFTRVGARSGGFFDADSTGSIVFNLPSGASATTEMLSLTHLVLASGDSATTHIIYDPATTLTLSVLVESCPLGPQYLIARLPESRRMRWTYFTKKPPMLPAPTGTVARADLRERFHRLALRKLGAFFDADTTGTWLANSPDADYHWMREDIYYAVALLDDESSASHRRANDILRTIANAQDRVTTSSTYGWFFTNAADLRVPNNASTFFLAPILAHLCLNPPATLEATTLAEMRVALRHVVDGVMSRFSFGPIYENFYFMGTATLAIAARVFDEPALADLARTKMRGAWSSFLPNGAHVESNSPVYIGVTAWALSLLVEDAQDTETVALAEQLLQRIFVDLAAFHQPALRQQAGPFSRVYEDGLRGAAGLTAFLTALELEQEGYDAPMRLAEMFEAQHTLDINPCYWQATRPPLMHPLIAEAMRGPRPLPVFVRQRNYHSDTASYLSTSFSLGAYAATTNYTLLGNEGLVLQVFEPVAPGGYAAVYARAGACNAEPLGYATGSGYDMFGFQHRERLLWLADRTFASSQAPASRVFVALIGDERFAQWEDVRINGAPVSLPANVGIGDVVTARRAGAFLAVQPLYAIAIGMRNRIGSVERQNGHLAIVTHALDAPAPEPLAGKRVEAAFAVTCSEASRWDSYDAFIADYLSSSSLEIVEDATSRTIVWEYGDLMEGSFHRASRQWGRRAVNGEEVGSPLLESDFAVQTNSSTLSLRDFTATDVPPYTWAVYPQGASSVLLANPSNEEVRVNTNWTDTPVTIAPYGFAVVTKSPPARVTEWSRY